MPDITNHNPPNIKCPFILSTDYVILCVSNMNDNKSVSCDNASIKCFKMAVLIIATALYNLINICIDQGCFPNYLSKIAKMIAMNFFII